MQNTEGNSLLQTLRNGRSELQRKIDAFTAEIVQYDKAIAAIEGSPSKVISKNRDEPTKRNAQLPIPLINNYNKNVPWAIKFVYFLKAEDRFLHFREVADFIVRIEGQGNPAALSRKLSSACKILKKSGRLVKVSGSRQARDTFWGKPEWLNEKGEIKKGHEFNEEYLTVNWVDSATGGL